MIPNTCMTIYIGTKLKDIEELLNGTKKLEAGDIIAPIVGVAFFFVLMYILIKESKKQLKIILDAEQKKIDLRETKLSNEGGTFIVLSP